MLLAEEAHGRDTATVRNRRRRAGFPSGKTFDAWDEQASSIPRPTQQALRTLEWVSRRENLCICGPGVIDGLIFEWPLSCRSLGSCDLCNERPAVVAS